MSIPDWSLLALLADGQPHHIQSLSTQLKQSTQQLHLAWRQMPTHIRGLLQCENSQWQLTRPLAILREADVVADAKNYGFQAQLLPHVTSTNDYLLHVARTDTAHIHGHICVCYEQRSGRGRQGRSWVNRLGECLMMSIGWVFAQDQSQLNGLAIAVAIAVCNALRQLHIPAQIKWPNDLVLGTDKLGGILIETLRKNNTTIAVIGLGLNVIMPKCIDQATSLQIIQPHIKIRHVYQSLLKMLSQTLPMYAQHGLSPFLLDDYRTYHRDHHQTVHLLRAGRPWVEGKVMGITDTGALRLQTSMGEQQFSSGEISLRLGNLPSMNKDEPPQSLLLLDAGNSKLKWAWVENHRIIKQGKAAYHELDILQKQWLTYAVISTRVIGCAVCGDLKQHAIDGIIPKSIQWLNSMPQALGIVNHYHHIDEHGSDRWFNILGSRYFTQHACVVVSCGTAVTIDALTEDNHYLGGSILPGAHLMKESLALHTANLNRPMGRPYPFATSTINAIASGVMDAVCGAILLMHQRLKRKITFHKPVDVVITGGGAARVMQNLPAEFTLDNRIEIVDNLVAYGLLNWVEHE